MVPMASGREADVYALDDGRVLRRYRRGGDTTAEASTMEYVRGLGYPVPRVYSADGPDLVLERVPGPTMLAAAAAAAAGGGFDAAVVAGMLADLHDRLHALPGGIVHLDLHPGNVILGPAGPVVIDWRNATEGPADLDLAMTALIMAEVAVEPEQPLGPLARAGLVAFIAACGGEPWAQLDEAEAMRRGNPTLSTAEIARLATAAALVRDQGINR